MNQAKPDHPRPAVLPPSAIRLPPLALVLCASVVVFALASPLLAQPDQVESLDDATFIAGLEDRGMSELILHYLETHPPDDPVVRRLIEIAQHRLRYRDRNLSREQRGEAFDRAIAGLEQLITDHPDRVQRPIWQTDLAAMRLIDDLRSYHRLAGAFVRFGVPDDEQRAAFAELAPEALADTSRARRRLFEMRGELARDDAKREALQRDGTWRRLFNEYAELRLPYYHALASLYVASLPDDADYFRSLPAGDVPGRADAPDAERRRLVREAIEAIEPLADESQQVASVARGALSVLGQLRLVGGEPRAAIEPLDEARSLGGGSGAERLMTILALARAYAETNRLEQGLNLIDAAGDDAAVGDSPFYRLLLADAAHRLLRGDAERQRTAANRQAAIERSYRPYLDLLESDALSDRERGTLRSFIYRRWASRMQEAGSAAALPPIVRMGVGEHLLTEARRVRSAGDSDRATELFERANAVNETLTDEDLPGRVRARGMYHLALGRYFLAPRDPANVARVAELMTDVADHHPDQAIAERAITNAVSLTRPLAAGSNRAAAGRSAYLRAVGVLLQKYPASPAADAERLPYAVLLLQPRGDHTQAIDLLEQVPRQHETYFEAQAALLRSHAAMFREATSDDARATRRSLAVSEANRLLDEARAAIGSDPGSLAAWAKARFTLAAAALDRGEVESAIARLEGFEDDFAESPDLVRRGYQEMIAARVEAEQLQQAVDLAQRMTRRFPDAAAPVINEVVTRLDGEIDALRRRADAEAAPTRARELRDRAQSKAEAAAELTGLLLDWARQQDLQPQQLLAYQVLHGKTLRLADRLDDSLAILKPLRERFASSGPVLFQYGQTQYEIGVARDDATALSEAVRALGALSSPSLYQPPYPEIFWVSNLRLVQVMDRRGDDPTDIVLRIRRLEQMDPGLGGEALQRRFNAIRARNS